MAHSSRGPVSSLFSSEGFHRSDSELCNKHCTVIRMQHGHREIVKANPEEHGGRLVFHPAGTTPFFFGIKAVSLTHSWTLAVGWSGLTT